jgi:hypothetical protein
MNSLLTRGTTAALTLTLTLPAPAAERDEAWARRQVERIRDSDTSDWQRIPWAGALTEARRLAQREGRPIFLFTMEGNLDTGRC